MLFHYIKPGCYSNTQNLKGEKVKPVYYASCRDKKLDRNGILINFGNITWQEQELVVQNGSKNAEQR